MGLFHQRFNTLWLYQSFAVSFLASLLLFVINLSFLIWSGPKMWKVFPWFHKHIPTFSDDWLLQLSYSITCSPKFSNVIAICTNPIFILSCFVAFTWLVLPTLFLNRLHEALPQIAARLVTTIEKNDSREKFYFCPFLPRRFFGGCFAAGDLSVVLSLHSVFSGVILLLLFLRVAFLFSCTKEMCPTGYAKLLVDFDIISNNSFIRNFLLYRSDGWRQSENL